MKISIDELRSLPHQRLNLSFKESIDGLSAVKPVLADFIVSAPITGMRLSGTIQTLLKLTCDRCLQPYFLSLNIPLEERFLEPPQEEELSQSSPKEQELTADDFIEYLSEDGTLDITDLVYQAVTLATPDICLCGEDCPGPAFPATDGESSSLAPNNQSQSGPDRVDPRWKNLKSLFPKQDTDAKS